MNTHCIYENVYIYKAKSHFCARFYANSQSNESERSDSCHRSLLPKLKTTCWKGVEKAKVRFGHWRNWVQMLRFELWWWWWWGVGWGGNNADCIDYDCFCSPLFMTTHFSAEFLKVCVYLWLCAEHENMCVRAHILLLDACIVFRPVWYPQLYLVLQSWGQVDSWRRQET